jgi:hypothetical protein
MHAFYGQKKQTYVKEVVEVAFVFFVVELAAPFANLVTFGIARWFENVSRLEEDLASVLVDLLEPVPQPLVPVRIIVQHIDRVLDLVHVPAVGEPFEKRPQLLGSLTKGGILDIIAINSCRWGAKDSGMTLATPLDSE